LREEAHHQANVLVVGAGPAGLSAALDARAAGAKRVMVVDRRSGHDRMRCVALEWEVLLLLEEWGIRPATFTPLETFTYIHGYGAAQRAEHFPLRNQRRHPSEGGGRVMPEALDILVRRQACATEEIRNIERALLTAAQASGIEVVFDAHVVEAPVAGSGEVDLRCKLDGKPAILRCEYLVVADGARSTVNELMGNPRIPSGYPAHEYVCAVFRFPRRNMLFQWVPRHDSGLAEITGVGNGVHYTLVSRLSPKLLADCGPAELDRRLAAMIQRGASSIGVDGPMVQGPMRFSTGMDRLRDVAMHPRILCVGDAARRGDPGFGGSLNEAIRDGRRFGNFYRKVSAQPDSQAAELARFRSSVDSATSALHTGGVLVNGLRTFLSIGHLAQSFLPRPLRSMLHLEFNLMMQAAGIARNGRRPRRLGEAGVSSGASLHKPPPGPRPGR